MLSKFEQFFQIYPTDILDVLIIALVIYSIFAFLRRTHNRMVFLGLVITVSLYIVARTLNLYLTFITLRYFVGISAIIFVIIFQSEIRRYFEFLGLAGTRQIKVGPISAKSPTTVEIIQACVKMAQDKVGALIVIQGEDSLEPHLEGGAELDGVISEDIILSIFDPHSDGHDGALIIQKNRISKFGVHLPLSTNFKEIGKKGTRHSAALGLSEVTDALCIVVSEEKGKISTCFQGKIKTLTQFGDLEKELNKYIKSTFAPPEDNKITQYIIHNFWLKAAALVSAVLIWYFTAYQAGIIEKSFDVPVQIENTPENIVIDDYSPKFVTVTVSGRGEQVFAGVTEGNFAVSIDTTKLENGVNKKVITSKNIFLPSNLYLTNIEPNSLLFTVTKYTLHELPIDPKVTGDPREGVTIESVVVNPETITVWVPEGTEHVREVETEIIDISHLEESSIIPTKLILPTGYKLANNQSTVNVAITVKKQQADS